MIYSLGWHLVLMVFLLYDPFLISLLSVSISAGFGALPGGVSQALIPGGFEPLIILPFSSYGCYTCPFTVETGERSTRVVWVDHLNAKYIPPCLHLRLLIRANCPAVMMTILFVCWPLDTGVQSTQVTVLACNSVSSLLCSLTRQSPHLWTKTWTLQGPELWEQEAQNAPVRHWEWWSMVAISASVLQSWIHVGLLVRNRSLWFSVSAS